MSKKSDEVKSGFSALDITERQEVINYINDFQSTSQTRQTLLKENLNRALNKSVGPRDSNACACCGK
jgi:hypothetical protein